MSMTNMPLQPIYLQNDPRWAGDTIGGSGEQVAAVGCTLCCVSMALAGCGIDLPPGDLNALLKQGNGYTERGWLEWGAVSGITGNRATIRVVDRPSHEQIDRALSDGQFVVAKIMLRGTLQHWVLIVGKDGREYLVKDPLGSGDRLDRLSALAPEIHSIRIAGPTMEFGPETGVY